MTSEITGSHIYTDVLMKQALAQFKHCARRYTLGSGSCFALPPASMQSSPINGRGEKKLHPIALRQIISAFSTRPLYAIVNAREME